MLTGAHAFGGFDLVADVREVFHPGPGDPRLSRGLDDGSNRFAAHVPNAPHVFGGDLPELLSSALAALGRKTTTRSKGAVTVVAHLFRRQRFCLCLCRQNSFAGHPCLAWGRMPEPAYLPFRRRGWDTTFFRERPIPVPSADWRQRSALSSRVDAARR